MSEISFTTITNDDIEVRVAVQGSGPLILCVHGWPELWYSWRHQMPYFAAKGYTVAAMDVRGYGGTSKPDEIERYTLTELASDVAAVVDALGGGEAILFGHDWGAPIVWNTARLYPDKIKAVAGLSVPYTPVGETSSLELWELLFPDRFFYQTYFVPEGIAESELGADSNDSIRRIYFALSGDGRGLFNEEKPADAALLDGLTSPDPFPAWASDDDLLVYSDALAAGGWRGPLNRYRAQTLDSEQMGAMENPDLVQPTAFIGGEFDPVRSFLPGLDLFDYAPNSCTDFRGTTIVPGAGHWVQQEAPDETNAALAAFVDSL